MKRLKEKGLTDAQIAAVTGEVRRILGASSEPGADTAKIYDEFVSSIARFGLTPDDFDHGGQAAAHEEFLVAYESLAEILAPFREALFIVDDNHGTRELLVELLDPNADWSDARRAVEEDFAERFPLWSVIVRIPGAPDETIGRGEP